MGFIVNPYRLRPFGKASRDFENGDPDYITIPGADIELILEGTAYTITAWTNAESYSAGSNNGIFCMSVNNPYPCLRLNGGYLSLSHNGIGTTDSARLTAVSGWRHVAGTFSTSNGTVIYKDGSVANSDPANTSQQSITNNTCRIGMDYVTTSGRGWDGLLADVRIYSRELNGNEISDLMSGVNITNGLEGWWLLNSDAVDDHSGNGYNGTNTGSVYLVSGPFG